ncbi:hypothetical protein E4T48_01179 [Aureobasidium sp. EXF-10727]|nr:hypothetical protein E4T48_01179 [Aureobasidium sp. EXF-10727]
MPPNKEAGSGFLNINPKTLRAAHSSKSKTSSSTAYGHTPGALGLHGWQPPQAHLFVSAPASVSSFSPIITQPLQANTSPTSNAGQIRHTIGSPEARLSSKTSGSPLKVRKTRENLRTGFINDADLTSEYSVPDITHSTHSSALPFREIRNTVHDEATRPSSRSNRFSWESNSVHLTTVIERSPTKRTSSQSDKNEPKSATSLSRKLSVRKRVVSKVKEGLLSRSKSSSKVPLRNDNDISVSRTASEHERFAQFMTDESSQKTRDDHTVASHVVAFDSVQSLVSADSPVGDFGPPIVTLPPPNPKTKNILPGSDGSYPSPSQEAEPSPSPSPEKTPRSERVTRSPKLHSESTHRFLSMLHINLRVTPAWATLDLADEATVWAVIKAEASVSSDPSSTSGTNDMRYPACPDYAGKTQKSLNVILIIDNSFALTRGRPFASPLALQSISEFTRRICSLLRDQQDRLAVFCTFCSHESQCSDLRSGCQLHRLQRPDASSLSIEVAKLDSGKATSQPSAAMVSDMMQEVVASVVEAVEDSIVTATHALVLSPLPHRCASLLRELVTWPIHQVQVGYAYESPSPHDQVRTGGWRFEWEEAQQTVLESLVQSARVESNAQELSHVRVSINSTEPCRVEKLLTPPRKATLHPGQCTTLFAKVRVPSLEAQQSADPTSLEGLISELHETLGVVGSELFKADVRYRHSLLPRNTELRTEQACELIRTNRNSQWGMGHSEEDKDGVEVEIEKAKFAARNYPPDVAIRILHRKFGRFWSGNDGPPVLRRLREELEFQQGALAQMSKSVVQSSTTATQHRNSKSTRRTTLHLADAEALQVYNTAPSTPTPEDGNTNTGMPADEHHTERGERPDSLVIQDEARRIWRHMRRNSRTTSGVASASGASSRAGSGVLQQERTLQQRGSQESIVDRMAATDTRVNEIRLKAIQNKRSVGADTLRDFSMMQQRDDGGPDELQHEACAPWL